MGKIALTFSYQAFTAYVRNNCDSEQEVDRSLVSEKWLYGNMQEYLSAHLAHRYDLRFEQFSPAEFYARGPGHPRQLDLVGYSRKKAEPRPVALLLEAKLMVDDSTA